MRIFTFKGLFFTAVFMLLGCLSIQAADDDLITKQITIKLDEAGTLPNRIAKSKIYKITNLKLVGEINGDDWSMIRDMAGCNYWGYFTGGKLSVLDLSEAMIVEGGRPYYCYSDDIPIYTVNNAIGIFAFYGCRGLTSLTLPANIKWIGESAFYGCSGLASIYVYAEKVPIMGEDVFKGCDATKCILYVPKGTYDDYFISNFGYFENIEEFEVTGIGKPTTSTDAKELSRYSVNGQRLSAPAKGLNIVKYSDGSVKKVVVQ